MLRRALRCTPALALCASALVSACAGGDKGADSARLADSAAAASAATTPPPPPSAPALTDANIVAILDGAHVTDSSAGSIAATKATAADVKSFARDMMRDHHAMRKAGEDLAKKLNVTPELPGGDNSAASAQSWRDSLNAMPKGAEWDKAYIDHEVTYHEAVLATAQSALGAAQNQELKDFIGKAAPNVEGHIAHAKRLQAKMAPKP